MGCKNQLHYIPSTVSLMEALNYSVLVCGPDNYPKRRDASADMLERYPSSSTAKGTKHTEMRWTALFYQPVSKKLYSFAVHHSHSLEDALIHISSFLHAMCNLVSRKFVFEDSCIQGRDFFTLGTFTSGMFLLASIMFEASVCTRWHVISCSQNFRSGNGSGILWSFR